MKKIQVLLLTAFIFLSLSESYGFLKQRHGWWNIRLKNLNKERILIINNKEIGRPVITLLDNEIERAKDILCVFENKNRNDGSLIYNKKKYKISEVKEYVLKTVKPLFSQYYLNFLVKQIGKKKTHMHTIDTVSSFLHLSINDHFGRPDKEFQKIITKTKITKNDWKYLSMEILFGRAMKSREKLFKKALTDIESRVDGELNLRKFILTPKELSDIVFTQSIEYLDKFNIESKLGFSQEALRDSWSWQKTYSRVLSDFNHLKDIINMLKKDSPNISIQRALYFYYNSVDLDAHLFESQSKQRRNIESLNYEETKSKNISGNIYVMNIPFFYDISRLFSGMDNIRKKALLRITGREDVKFYDRLNKRFNKIIEEYSKSIGDAFFREEERLKLTIENIKNAAIEDAPRYAAKEPDVNLFNERKKELVIANEKEFLEAKRLFTRKVNNLYRYKQKSVKFLEWLSNSKKIDGDKILLAHKKHAERNYHYLTFVASLVESLTEIDAEQSLSFRKRILLSLRRTGNIFKAIGFSLSLEKKYLPYLHREKLKRIKYIKSELAAAIRRTRLDVNAFQSAFIKKYNDAKRDIRKREDKLNEKIAEFEIEIFHKKIQEYISLYDNLKYAEIAFANYSGKFYDFQKEAASGNISKSLDYSLKMKSIMPVLKDFNKGKIKRQYATKRFLKKETNIAISRLMTLLKLYKRKGIAVRNRPDNDKIKKIKLKLKKRIEVQIASWRMNETNIDRIDKNAIKKLNFIRNRRSWDIAGHNDSKNNSLKTITIQGMKLSLVIPDGWAEKKPREYTGSRKEIMEISQIRSFKSFDGSSDLHIVRMPLDGKDGNEITGDWLQTMNGNRVKERWGKKDELEYFWTISKNNKKKIIEIYTITREDYALILSGITTKDKYRYFKRKIDFIFNSIKTGEPSIFIPDQKEKGLGML